MEYSDDIFRIRDKEDVFSNQGGFIMYGRMGKTLGMITPLISLWSVYQMLFGAKYSDMSSDDPMIKTITAFQYAVDNGSNVILFWSVFVFVISVIGGLGAWYKRPIIVWPVAIILLIVSILGTWSIGGAVVPLAGLFFISATLLTVHKKKVVV